MSEQQRTGVLYVAQAAYDEPISIRRAYDSAEYYLSLQVGRVTNDRRRYIVQYLPDQERRNDENMFMNGQVEIRRSVLIALASPADCRIGEHALISNAAPLPHIIHHHRKDIMVFERDNHGLAKRVQ